MSMEESQARLRASRTEVNYHWFEGKDLKDFFEAVEDHGAENVRIRAYPGLNEKGYPDLHLEVVPHNPEEDCGLPFNCSHPCPPDC
jgi:hypothetical protein